MSCLAPCPACNRHVATDQTACPFCSAALPDSIRCQERKRPHARLSRAAMMAAGVVLVSVEAGCSVATPLYGSPAPYDAGVDTATDTGTTDGGAAALSGAAPETLEQTPPDPAAKPPAGS
jgi:hypothetical protein